MNANATEVSPDTLERLRLDHRLNIGASWFYWIAIFTLVSSLIAVIGNRPFGFIIGLGTTQIIDSLGQHPLLKLSLDIVLACLFLFLGRKARRGQREAFVLGIILYGLDSLIFITVQDYVGFIFHAFVILGLLGGIQALNQMDNVSSQSTAYNVSR